MKMHVLSGGRLRVRKTMYDANAVRGETLDVPVSCILLRHGQGNVLFDTGCHPAVAENAQARWGGLAKIMTPVMQPGDHVIAALGGIGLTDDDIDVVVCSHLHPDHCGCNTFFKRATFVIGTDGKVLDVITSEVNMAKHADRALDVLRHRSTV